MKLLAITTAIAAVVLSLTIDNAQAACSRVRIKKEWNRLSSSEQRSYVKAVETLMGRKDIGPNARRAKEMSYNDFVNLHSSQTSWVHNGVSTSLLIRYPFITTGFFFRDGSGQGSGGMNEATFLPALVWAWDEAIIDAGFRGDGGDELGSPVWDWSLVPTPDSWQRAGMLTSQYLGTTGKSEADACLTDGIQKKQKGWAPFQGDRDQCLKRVWANQGFYDASTVNGYLNDNEEYDVLRRNVENVHVNVHVYVGGTGSGNSAIGDMANVALSPNDAMFYLHHGMVDKIWFRWQKACNGRHMNSYGSSTSSVSVNDDIRGFEGVFKVRDVLNAEESLCFTYENTASDRGDNGGDAVVFADNCGVKPSTTATTTTTSAKPTQTEASAAEKVWFQEMLKNLFPIKAAFAPVSALRRDVEILRENLFATTTETASPTTSFGYEFTLPPTKTVGYSSTVEVVATHTPRFKTSGGFITEIYTPDSVMIGGYEIKIPKGERVIYIDSLNVKTVPIDFVYNETTRQSNYPGLKPKIYRPVRAPVAEYVPKDPKCTPPAEPHPTALSYPGLPPKEYFEKMGMDYHAAVEMHNKAKAKIDAYNCDPNSLSPAARILREKERAEEEAKRKAGW
ncbi:hypothetical protein HDU97_009936 [Phlyctochytrium planicorne]|nr:hypothetical protein HDU97_009936 [Phlyctochytrium planicorne]